jgi:hypothetical protein
LRGNVTTDSTRPLLGHMLCIQHSYSGHYTLSLRYQYKEYYRSLDEKNPRRRAYMRGAGHEKACTAEVGCPYSLPSSTSSSCGSCCFVSWSFPPIHCGSSSTPLSYCTGHWRFRYIQYACLFSCSEGVSVISRRHSFHSVLISRGSSSNRSSTCWNATGL